MKSHLRGYWKLIAFALLPLLVALVAIGYLSSQQAKNLSKTEVETLRQSLINVRKTELRTHMVMALNAIDKIYQNPENGEQWKKQQAAKLLSNLAYGPDGYFFIYTYDGINVMHPRQPYRVGKNWINLKDKNGVAVIKELIEKAKAGGGYTNYQWEKPSLNKAIPKIAYSIALPKWNWMIGTGLYIDDIQNQVASLEAQIKANVTQAFLMVSLIAFASLALVFASAVYYILNERRLAANQLKGLNKRVAEAQEEERKRVAQELHDGISQILISVKYNLELTQIHIKNKTEDIAKPLLKGTEGLSLAISEVRRVSRNLRPGILDDLGLSPALKTLGDEFSERVGMIVKQDITPVKDQLIDGAKTAMFRVAQEAFTNIERHSGASEICVKLYVENNHVYLSIKDNGCGFKVRHETDKTASNYGIGLRNMKERLAYYDGELNVKSSESGTLITAILPTIKPPKTKSKNTSAQLEHSG